MNSKYKGIDLIVRTFHKWGHLQLPWQLTTKIV